MSESYHIPLNSGDLPGAIYNEKNLDTWVYPASKAFRTYQYKIVRSALFENTLVTLPTGLGKTFIASAVMFNFYRWFKDGLIFFVAPTKPLVTQQSQSFGSTITEIPLNQIAELNGNMSKQNRQKAYKTCKVFFMTPQTLQSDIQDCLFDPTKLTLLVIDEAHRATGNYAYCNVIK